MIARALRKMANSVGFKCRKKRADFFIRMIKLAHLTSGYVRVIDVGGSEEYWRILPEGFLELYNVQITILNLSTNSDPKYKGVFEYVNHDACNLSLYPDKYFHIAHSNSVIEHVGDSEKQEQFAKEIQRVSKKYIVQTPDPRCPIEPHFLLPFANWMPMAVRAGILTISDSGHLFKQENYSKALEIVRGIKLINRDTFKNLFPGARIFEERIFGIPKSLIAVRGLSI